MSQSIRDGKAEVMTAKAAGLILLFSFLFFYVPIFSIFALGLCAVPTIVVSVRYGFGYGVLSALLAGGLIAVFIDPISAFTLVIMVVLLGVSQGMAIRNGSSSYGVVFSGIASVMAALVFIGLLFYALSGKNMVIEQVSMIKETIRAEVDSGFGSGLQAVGLEENLKIIDEAMDDVAELYPLGLFIVSWLVAGFSYYISAKVLGHLGFITPKKIRLKELRLHPIFSWGFLVGLAAYLFSSRFGAQAELISMIGLNLLFIFGMIFLLQGTAVIIYIISLRKFGPGLKIFMVTFSLFAQLVFWGITWLGLFDTWFNYRKLSYDQE
ncbi:MAG: DUF2232 domain-containing protein [Actinomycetota bacterium]|nr:DUF2232 domain-containing protein [Actinomycetota bacterium]